MPEFEHPRQLFSIDYPEDWEVRFQEDTGSVILFDHSDEGESGLALIPMLDPEAQRTPEEAISETARSCGVSVEPGQVRVEQVGEEIRARAEVHDPREQAGGAIFRFWLLRRGALSVHMLQYGPGAAVEAPRRAADAVVASLRLPEILPPTPQEFRDRVLEVLAREHPETRATATDMWTIEVANAEGETTGQLGLENVYRRCLLNPESAGAIIREHLDRTLGSVTTETQYDSFGAVRDRLLPVLKGDDWVRDVSAQLELARLPYADGLNLCFVIDEPAHVAYVSREMLEKWGEPLERLQGAAQDNLARKSEGVELAMLPGEDGQPVALVINTGDGYDAARLLLPGMRELFAEHLGDEFLAGLPNRDFLIAFSQRDSEVSANIIRQIKADYQRMNHPISSAIYKVGADSVERTEL